MSGLSVDLPIATERLMLRAHRMDDLVDLVRFHGDPEVVRYVPWPVRDREATEETLRTKLGQQERARKELRELILITDDEKARRELIEKLAELEGTDSAEVASEIFEARKRFEAEWLADRPYMPASLYILIGPTPKPGFDPADLATGGRELVGTDLVAPVEPMQP